MHVGAQRLQALLVAHAEAMLLVDDEESEVLEARVRVQQAVRGDDDVDLAVLEALEDRLGLLRGAEARQRLDAHRPVGEAVAEVRQVLLHQQRRRREHRDLLAGLCVATNAARIATSVLPKPTSPQTMRSIGRSPADRASTWRIDLRLILGLLEREGVGEGLVIELARP